ncbi:MAG: hypothetical protein B6242_09040 [Anaerolineaceae bacterium 4572_78]|nr:MAG: hypothetical protein B6242_09040 [Anaerolineaceae bacterium 4572_78]
MKRSFDFRKILIPFLVLILAIIACGGGDSSSSSSSDSDLPSNPVAGSQLNKYFPKSDGGYDVIHIQEKSGFSEAKLKKGGSEVATLAITDLASNPSARDKYKSSSKKIAGYPATNSGSKGTAILVGNRYQVQVRSKDSSFGESDRETWLKKFNLSGLSKLK